MIVVHHRKKNSDVATTPLEKVIGSIGITGTAETILVMEQQTGTKDCKLNLTGKDVEQCDKYLNWNGMDLISMMMLTKLNLGHFSG